ncbi:class I SAM-dependent methyltransferase [Paenibacillus sp. WQ 127069]|uniref:Class I SAM-dependent methyltransferase n=1 Tax=Paenibacillus baimaensis TaxID=2982185 RepID=A0ABT2USE1_9BACL|nr:class I SAM-dependent methyltransferase [Paenibacillus sp. WQ 127069]MCU6796584.1 class I SAM-dependent methyltransferase [Paenibacillus sp. WQ 127069]
MKWIFHNPDFAYVCYHPTILNISAWLGHRHFAYDLIRFMKPDTLVELGTHWGASFFSFCQAVADDDQVQTDCYAVDSWEGDPHAGLYTNEVYATVSRVTEQLYAPKASLIRKTFDEAANDFENETVQILHIDGYHTYEAVSHDYHTWLPKVAPNGIVLFHDISCYFKDFGVHQFWDQLKVQYPHIEFTHSWGLGVLFPKGVDARFQEVLAMRDFFSHIYSSRATELARRGAQI